MSTASDRLLRLVRRAAPIACGLPWLASACSPLRVPGPTAPRHCGGPALPMVATVGGCAHHASYAQTTVKAPNPWPLGCVPSGELADDRTLLRDTGLRGNEPGLTAARGVWVTTLDGGERQLRWAVRFDLDGAPRGIVVDAVTGARLEYAPPGSMAPPPELFPVADELWGSTDPVALAPPACPSPGAAASCHPTTDDERARLGPQAPIQLCGSLESGDFSYTTDGPCPCVHRTVRGVAQAPRCAPCAPR